MKPKELTPKEKAIESIPTKYTYEELRDTTKTYYTSEVFVDYEELPHAIDIALKEQTRQIFADKEFDGIRITDKFQKLKQKWLK